MLGEQAGVAEGRLRKWLLSIAAFLRSQNGGLGDAMRLWRDNCVREFDGLEECLICYSGACPAPHTQTPLAPLSWCIHSTLHAGWKGMFTRAPVAGLHAGSNPACALRVCMAGSMLACRCGVHAVIFCTRACTCAVLGWELSLALASGGAPHDKAGGNGSWSRPAVVRKRVE